jgi:hypothetical protein
MRADGRSARRISLSAKLSQAIVNFDGKIPVKLFISPIFKMVLTL